MLIFPGIILPSESKLNSLLDRTKGRLFFKKKAGFIGSLLCDHSFVWDESADTAWCNGTEIGWNPYFFLWLTPEERVTVLGHELWHTGFGHMSRLGSRCPDRWNQAADHVINNMLKNDGYVFGPKLLSLGPCMEPRFNNMSTEQVYNLLPDNPGQPMPQECNDPSLKGAGTTSPNSSDQPQDGSVWIFEPGENSGHGPMGKDVKPLAKEDHAQVKAKIIKAIQSAQMSKEAGDIPGEITLTIDEFLNPILPWEVLLQKFFNELSNDDYSWKRPSRRYDDEYLPSLIGDNQLEHLTYYLDVSGSVSDRDVKRFHSEVKYIHEAFQPKKITLVTFDTKIQNEVEFADDDPFEKITISGRGGTSLDPVRLHIKQTRPTAAVIFSDLLCYPMEEDPKIPLLWVVVGNPHAKVKFGKPIHIANEI
jgi:predicted metal-dependent peptidase